MLMAGFNIDVDIQLLYHLLESDIKFIQDMSNFN